jgi:glyoxylase-like metal-dependent hydrolase (beta-lactamase superfamily II)
MSPLPKSLLFLERDWLSANHILGFDEQGATVVDTGYAKHQALTLALVQHALQQQPVPTLLRIVNTHLHSDHCGGNARLQQHYQCELLVAQADFDTAANWDTQALSFDGTGQQCDRFLPTGSFCAGDILRIGGLNWEVLAAPGHDPHSVILYQPEHQLLISADALWENGFGVTFPELLDQPGFTEQHQVLKVIQQLPVKWVLPGHGAMFNDAAKAVDIAFSRLKALQQDPRRNARLLLKVLLKFALLDIERINVSEITQRFSTAIYLNKAAQHLNWSLEHALFWAMDELVAQQQLRREGDVLLNA